MIQSNDIRLAVDSGEVLLGIKQVIKSIEDNSSKLVITANKNKLDTLNDLKYITDISNIKLEIFKGNSAELGSVCGKPYSVSTLSIINPGDSNILNNEEEHQDEKNQDKQQKKEEDTITIQEELEEIKQEEQEDNKEDSNKEIKQENEQKSD